MNNNDPTFKPNGWLFFAMINNGVDRSITSKKGVFTGPSQPVHPWREGTDYLLYDYSRATQPWCCYAWRLGYVSERGPAAISPGETFAFEFEPRENKFRFRVEIIGVEGGSVLRPSVGIYNLRSKPGEWTYKRPERFTGEWGFQVVARNNVLPIGVSVIYNPGETPTTEKSWSSLNIRFDGAWLDCPIWAGMQTPVEAEAIPMEVLSSSTSEWRMELTTA